MQSPAIIWIVHMNLTKEIAIEIVLTSNGKLNSFYATGNYYKIGKKKTKKKANVMKLKYKDRWFISSSVWTWFILPHASFNVLRLE